MRLNRRRWLAGVAGAAAGERTVALAQTDRPSKSAGSQKPPLLLVDYQPKSMLHVPQTEIPRARFPVVDFHTHLTRSDTLGGREKTDPLATPEEVLPVMDRRNVRMMVNVTGCWAWR